MLQRLPSRMVTQCLLRQGVEPSGLNITLQLRVSDSPVELEKPGAELGQLVSRKCSNLLLEVLDLTHVYSLTEG